MSAIVIQQRDITTRGHLYPNQSSPFPLHALVALLKNHVKNTWLGGVFHVADIRAAATATALIMLIIMETIRPVWL